MPLSNPQDVAAHAAIPEAHQVVLPLTVLACQQNPATGDMNTASANINDQNVATGGGATVIGQYAEIDFTTTLRIEQFRQYGSAGNNGDGSWKLTYWDGQAWQDWETGIVTRPTADWSTWASPAAGRIETSKIRIVCTAVDSGGGGQGFINELELKL